MITTNNLFFYDGGYKSTDIMELLITLTSTSIPLDDKRVIWHTWKDSFYNIDELREFFSDSLFIDDGIRYLDVVCKTDYKNFYEMVLSLDLAGFDPRAYYLYWILSYGRPTESKLIKDAFEYDPDTIRELFPDIEEVVFCD